MRSSAGRAGRASWGAKQKGWRERRGLYPADKDGKIGGLGVVAAEPKELTIISIVGAIDPEQLGDLSGRFGIPKIELEQKKKTGKDD